MRQTAIQFTSDKLSLEGVLTLPQGVPGAHPVLLVCHAHPALGGNMDNQVIAAICRAAEGQGIASLRFNFRGVGDSEGQFSNGEGEQRDLESALNVLRRWPEIDPKRLALVGYSFGASVLLDGLGHCKSARSLAFIAPPISSVRGSRIRKDSRPKLFLVGQRDRIVPSVQLQRALDEVRQPMHFSELHGADHGLIGHEEAVADCVVDFLVATHAE